MTDRTEAAPSIDDLTSSDATTRWRAAVMLARAGNAAAAETLASFLADPSAVSADEAGLVLDHQGRRPPGLGGNDDPDTLVDAVMGYCGWHWPTTTTGDIRTAAAWALGLIGDARALPILLPLVQHGKDAGSIVSALERIVTRDAARASDADLRTAAALTAPPQIRGFGDDSQFGAGPGITELEPLNLDVVRALASAELARRAKET